MKCAQVGAKRRPGRISTAGGFLAGPNPLGQIFRNFVQKIGKVKKIPLTDI